MVEANQNRSTQSGFEAMAGQLRRHRQRSLRLARPQRASIRATSPSNPFSAPPPGRGARKFCVGDYVATQILRIVQIFASPLECRAILRNLCSRINHPVAMMPFGGNRAVANCHRQASRTLLGAGTSRKHQLQQPFLTPTIQINLNRTAARDAAHANIAWANLAHAIFACPDVSSGTAH